MDKFRKIFKTKRTSSESRHISNVSFDTNEDKIINKNVPVDINNDNDEYSNKRKEDIKARFFEVCGTGAFLLSYNVKYLSNYLII